MNPVLCCSSLAVVCAGAPSIDLGTLAQKGEHFADWVQVKVWAPVVPCACYALRK